MAPNLDEGVTQKKAYLKSNYTHSHSLSLTHTSNAHTFHRARKKMPYAKLLTSDEAEVQIANRASKDS